MLDRPSMNQLSPAAAEDRVLAPLSWNETGLADKVAGLFAALARRRRACIRG